MWIVSEEGNSAITVKMFDFWEDLRHGEYSFRYGNHTFFYATGNCSENNGNLMLNGAR